MPITTELPWLNRLILTAFTTGVAVLIAMIVNLVVLRRLSTLTKYTRGDWDDVLIAEVRRRMPFWGLLAGLWLSVWHWRPLLEGWVGQASADDYLGIASRVIAAIGIISVTLTFAAVATRMVSDYGQRATHGAPVPGLVGNIVRFVVVAMGLLIVLRGFGVEITPILAALGVGGLAVALALQDPLANLFAGVFVTIAGQMRIGDYVKMDFGVEGTITDFNWHSTRILAPSGDPIIVPNSRIAKAVVTNFSLPTREVGFAIEFVVAHGTDVARLERATLEVAREVERGVDGGVAEFDPLMRVLAYTDLGMRVAVVMRARAFTDQAVLKHELLKRLDVGYRQEGIVLARAPMVMAAPPA
jgi:small-conductance mechanosensitive channel